MGSDTLLVSVIVPVYNGARHLAEALGSIVAQDYDPIEIIVVDDGSVDYSAEIAGAYDEVRLIRQQNKGPGASRNRGIEVAKGGFIAFLDQDDLWRPRKLSCQINALMEDPHLLYVIGRQEYFLEPGIQPPAWFKKKHLMKNHVAYEPGMMVARREAFDVIGFFDPDLLLTSDVDWFFRAKDQKAPMLMLPDLMLRKRVHSENQSFQSAEHNRELLTVLKRSMQRQRGSTPGE